MNQKEVWVTGLGIISLLGFNIEQFSDNLYLGEDKSSYINCVDVAKLKRKKAALITREFTKIAGWQKYTRGVQMALLSVQEALRDAGFLESAKIDNAGICMGTMLGQIPDFQKSYYELLQNNKDAMYMEEVLQFPMDYLVDVLAKEFQITGLRNVISSVCVSSAMAIGTGYRWIQRGRADIVICGGAENFSLLGHQLMSCLGIISKDTTKPFDESSSGFLLGEGAGIVILESEEHARKRHIQPYCKLDGYGCSCDAHDMSHPDENGYGLQSAIKKAIEESKESIDNIGFINAHGVGTKSSDEAEMRALEAIFGKRIEKIPIYSIKGAVGHTSGAAGVMNVISAILSMRNRCIPPTVNYKQNKEFDNFKITRKSEITNSKRCISISVGFGGLNTCIALKRV